MRRWPVFGIIAAGLILGRGFVETPSLVSGLQAQPTDATVKFIDDRGVGLIVGGGVTFLGLASLAIFIAGLWRAAQRQDGDSLTGPLILLGGGVCIGTVFAGFGFAFILAGAAMESRAPTTVAAIYTIADSFAYIGWTALGLVTGAVSAVSLRGGVFPRWLGWFSAIITVVFALLAFLPFLSWVPALLWLLVAGIGLLAKIPDERKSA